jgi:hypothetical protein
VALQEGSKGAAQSVGKKRLQEATATKTWSRGLNERQCNTIERKERERKSPHGRRTLLTTTVPGGFGARARGKVCAGAKGREQG